MGVPVTGRVHGNTIELDTLVPSFDGKRVVALLETVEEAALSVEAQRAAWATWVARGPQGPIDDEGGAEFP